MDSGSMVGHSLILAALAWIGRALHQSGIRFDFHIWKNGKKKQDETG